MAKRRDQEDMSIVSILDDRKKGKNIEYLVRTKGAGEDTWIASKDFSIADEVLQEYKKAKKASPPKKRAQSRSRSRGRSPGRSKSKSRSTSRSRSKGRTTSTTKRTSRKVVAKEESETESPKKESKKNEAEKPDSQNAESKTTTITTTTETTHTSSTSNGTTVQKIALRDYFSLSRKEIPIIIIVSSMIFLFISIYLYNGRGKK